MPLGILRPTIFLFWIALEFVLRQIRAMTDFCNRSNFSLFISVVIFYRRATPLWDDEFGFLPNKKSPPFRAGVMMVSESFLSPAPRL